MTVENRLSAEQLAALAPGDEVVIESGADLGRRRYTTAVVARVTARHVVVRCGVYVECYRLRDGIRDGGTGRAELVHGDLGQPASHAARRQAQHIERAYREWTRNRTDEKLRRLHDAVTQCLEGSTAGVS